jgi:hypothetical protein
VRELLSRRDLPADDAAFISIDGRGADVRVRTGGEYNVERIGFDEVCEGLSCVLAGAVVQEVNQPASWRACAVCGHGAGAALCVLLSWTCLLAP